MRKTLLTLALTASTIAATACGAQSNPTGASASAAATADANRAALQATLAAEAQASPATTPMREGGMRGGRMRRGPMLPGDTNRDGVLTRAEAIAQADARFAEMDQDGDGILTAGEREAARDAMRDRREARMAARGRTAPDRAPDAQGRRRGNGMAQDGVVTRAEFQDRAAQRFDRMDANRDGRIDASERPDRRAMRHGRGGGRRHAMDPNRAQAGDSTTDRSMSNDDTDQ